MVRGSFMGNLPVMAAGDLLDVTDNLELSTVGPVMFTTRVPWPP